MRISVNIILFSFAENRYLEIICYEMIVYTHMYLAKFILSFSIYRLLYIKSSRMYIRPAFFPCLMVQHGFPESGFSFTPTNVTYRFKSFIIFNNLS